jgi:hypothetical protein
MSGIEIKLLKSIENGDSKRDDLARANNGLFFHSSARINFLKRYLDVEDHSLAASISGKLVGFLNVLVKNGTYGKVANSSPFYGSNGGIILDRLLPEAIQKQIKLAILESLYAVEKEHSIAMTCIITNPLYKDEEFYKEFFIHDLEDFRIGQLTPLPKSKDDIFPLIHSKTRNLVRKAQKFAFDVCTSRERADVDFLWETHKENMEEIGGKAKEKDYFEQSLFNSDYPWTLWVASHKGERAAAMLLYNYGDVIEYVTPVIKLKFRSEQPLSLLIFEAMNVAIQRGAKWWNWGGTWKTQDGVYHFKSRWGAIDMNYYYFIKFASPAIKERFLSLTKDTLLSEYPYFFSVPFDLLKSQSAPQ